jgi:LPXTG-motif cell wall-anchored protein
MHNNRDNKFTHNKKGIQLAHNNSVRKFSICLAVLLISVFFIGQSSFKVLAASPLAVSPTVDNNKVIFKISDSINLSDAISIVVMQKGTNSIIYMDQGKLNNGEYTFSTVLPKGDYTGYVSSSTTDNVPIQDFVVVNNEKIVGFRTIAPLHVEIGSNVILPSTVIAIFDDGANRMVGINWETTPDTTVAGKQTVLGSIDGYDIHAMIEVNVGDKVDKVYSTDATLSGITVGGSALPNFKADKASYDVELPIGTTAVPMVVATVSAKDKANAVVTQATSLPGTTKIVVTAEDGTSTKTYNINFTVAQPASNGGNGTPSDNTGGTGGNDNAVNNGNTNNQENKIEEVKVEEETKAEEAKVEETKAVNKLAKTGSYIDFNVIASIGFVLMGMGIGFVVLRKKKEN